MHQPLQYNCPHIKRLEISPTIKEVIIFHSAAILSIHRKELALISLSHQIKNIWIQHPHHAGCRTYSKISSLESGLKKAVDSYTRFTGQVWTDISKIRKEKRANLKKPDTCEQGLKKSKTLTFFHDFPLQQSWDVSSTFCC